MALACSGEAPGDGASAANSNCSPSRRYRIRQEGVIRTGPFVGLRKRRPTDRSRALDLDHVRGAVNAAAFASSAGWPLSVQLTIAWELSEYFADEGWATLQTRLFNEMGRYLRRRGIEIAFVWTRERAPGRGAHTHAAVHLGGKPIDVAAGLLAYLTDKFSFAPGAVDISMGKFGAMTPSRRAGIMLYLLKGIDHAAFRFTGNDGSTENIGAALGIDHRGQQGHIAIKRAGVSQNVALAARKRAGWREVRDLEGLSRLLNPPPPESAAHARPAPAIVVRASGASIAGADGVSLPRVAPARAGVGAIALPRPLARSAWSAVS